MGAVYVLLTLFVASWAGQFVTTVIDVGNDPREHGQFAMSDAWPRYLNATGRDQVRASDPAA